mgnify:CR=1 FL=1
MSKGVFICYILLKVYTHFTIENEMIKLLLKMVAIGYLTEFSSGLLVDFGNVSLADKVVLAGKITIIFLSLPIFETLLKIIQTFLSKSL